MLADDDDDDEWTTEKLVRESNNYSTGSRVDKLTDHWWLDSSPVRSYSWRPFHFWTQSPATRCQCCALQKWSCSSVPSEYDHHWPVSESCCHQARSWDSRSR